MNAGELSALLTAIGAGVIGLLSFFRSLRNDRVNREKQTTEQKEAEFGANLRLMERIDLRVDALVDERIGQFRDDLETERSRTDALIRIVRVLVVGWPAGAPRPPLPPDAVAKVPEVLPSDWRN